MYIYIYDIYIYVYIYIYKQLTITSIIPIRSSPAVMATRFHRGKR